MAKKEKLPKDLLTLLDFTPGQIRELIALAARLKAKKAGERPLHGKTVAVIFEKPSLRTRVTFETGIVELGGHPIYLAPENIQMGKRESPRDIARNLERWVQGIVARVFSHAHLEELAANAKVPVINALSDRFHPCQALATGLTLLEHFGRLKNLTLAFVGDGNNVAASLLILSAKLGLNAKLVCPKGFELPALTMDRILQAAGESGASITTGNDPAAGVRGADLIYTDVWASMGQESEAESRKKIFAPFQVNARLVAAANPGCRVSHCLPAHKGEEITGDVFEKAADFVFDEAENRLHVQKAVLRTLLK